MQSETKTRTTSIEIHISEINDAKLIGKRVVTEALVNDLEEIPFVPPSQLHMECQPDPDNISMCRSCFHTQTGGGLTQLGADNPDLLKFINCKDGDLRKLYKSIVKVPSKCSRAIFTELERNNVTQGSLVPTIEYIDKDDDESGTKNKNMYSVIIEAVFIGKDLVEANRSYRLQGVPQRDPKNGRITLVVDKAEGIMDDINGFKLTEDMKECLKIFQPKDDSKEALVEKLADIHNEMRINHHKINGRENVAFFTDLAYHSVMGFRWGNDLHLRGWMQLCLCGDTSVGKSELLERTMKMHQMGYLVPGESVSYAGLMGGVVSQNNKRNGNTLHWGVLPKHHRRIVLFDEAHNENAIKIWTMLNDVNSSGIAKYNKIIQRQTLAMVRKIFSSNPPEGTTVNDYLHPCEMLKYIYRTAETIRRFDALVVPTALDVAPSLISREEPMIDAKYYDLDGCPNPKYSYEGKSAGYWLLRFIYSRTPEQVVFDEDARQLIIKESDRLCKKYSGEGIPLVEAGSIRFKIARGAAPVAGRTCSVNTLFDTIIVQKRHVEVYIEALEAQYDGTTGYLGYSEKMFKLTQFENDENFYEICCRVREAFHNKNNAPLLEHIYQQNTVNFKELGFTWDVPQEVFRRISTAMMSNGLVVPNRSMTNFRKNRKGLLVLKYLKNVDLSMALSEAHCKAFFKANT